MVKLAIKQVGNPRFKSNLPVPEVSGFFTGIFGGEPQQGLTLEEPQQGLTLEAALKRAWKNRNQIRSSYLRGWIEGVAPKGKFHSWFKTISEDYKNPYKAHNHRTRNNNLVGRILDVERMDERSGSMVQPRAERDSFVWDGRGCGGRSRSRSASGCLDVCP
jgi:hypothetical protein